MRVGLIATAFLLVAACRHGLSVGSGPEVADGGTESAGGGIPPGVGPGIVDVATMQPRPGTLVVDSENVYWLGREGDAGCILSRAPKTGGITERLFQGNVVDSLSNGGGPLALDDVWVYFKTAAPVAPLASLDNEPGIWAVHKNGGGARLLAPSDSSGGAWVVVDGQLFWFEYGSNILGSMSTAGGGATRRATFDHPATVATATPGDAIYAAFALEGLLRIAFDGGTPTSLDPTQQFPAGLVADDHELFMGSGNAIKAIPKTGGPSRIVTVASDPAAIAIDADSVYIAQRWPTNRIAKVPKAGGSTTTIADHQGNPISIAVDDHYVYWSATDDGAIRRAPK